MQPRIFFDHFKVGYICAYSRVVEKKLFLTIWYAGPKNVLIKEDVEIWSNRGYNWILLWTKANNWSIYDWCKQGGGLI